MTIQLNKAASFFGKQDVAIEVLSFLDPHSMACAFAVCKDFQGVKHEVFAVFLRTCSGLISLDEAAKLSTQSLKNPQDWGALCNRMEGRFAVQMDLSRDERSIAQQRFRSVLFSSNIAQLRRLSVQDQFRHAGSQKPPSILGNPELLVLTKAAPHLQQLELVRSGVTAEGLGCLRNLELEALSLTRCRKITDNIADELAGMTSLTELGLSGCERVTERGLGMLLQTLKNLRKVDISDEASLPSEKERNHQMVQALTDHGKQLTHIEMDHLGCDFSKIEAMVKSCKNLVFLSHVFIRFFNTAHARMLQKINPNLSVRILKRKLQEDSSLKGILFEGNGRPRVKLLNPRRRAYEPFEIVKPLPRATTVEEYVNIVSRYSGERASFVCSMGDWISGIGDTRYLKFNSTSSESLIEYFKLRGYKDGTVSLWVTFNQKIFQRHLDQLGPKVVCPPDYDRIAFKTQTRDELRQVVGAILQTGSIPEPYHTQIGEIVRECQDPKIEQSKKE